MRSLLFSLLFATILIPATACQKGERAVEPRDAPVAAAAAPQPNPTPPVAKSTEPIAIQSPAAGAQVEHRVVVRGTVADPQAKVWVIVRPMRRSEYWVQPPVDVDSDGTWSTEIYVGEGPATHSGEHFKIMAVANPAAALREGERLRDWPSARWRSRMIEVVKR